MPSTGDRLKEAQAWHRHRNFLHVIEYLRAHPCTDCGETDPVVLDFDHLPGTEKRFEVARAVNASTRSWESIATEIEKCEVVCANCHRRRTARRAGHRKFLLSAGLPLDQPAAPGGRVRVPHGGGAKGRRGCPCALCTERRREYARSLRAAAKEAKATGEH